MKNTYLSHCQRRADGISKYKTFLSSLLINFHPSKWKVIKLLYINAKSKAVLLGDKCAKRLNVSAVKYV